MPDGTRASSQGGHGLRDFAPTSTRMKGFHHPIWLVLGRAATDAMGMGTALPRSSSRSSSHTPSPPPKTICSQGEP